MVRQTIKPAQWVIVNDGSKDATGQIIDEYARQYPWIKAVHRQDRGYRKFGGGIIEAFYAGYNALTVTDWDFMTKLDGDFSFEPGYFERCFEHFATDPRLGIGGGFLYNVVNGHTQIEEAPTFHVRGGAKTFRRECWNAIGGLWVGLGSDTLDEVKANMLGWKSRSFRDALILHHRPTGTTWGTWGSLVKNGRTDYVCGYHPLFILAKCAVRLVQRPYVVGSAGILFGFVSSYWQKIPRVNDADLIKYLRREQIKRLLGQETIWR